MFGRFEVDLDAGELWKGGFRVKLQSQPFRVLAALLERPGQVVTREELQVRLWGRETTVDFDHALGTAVNKIREALGDSAENPRFVETLARRGYRFIAPVHSAAEPVSVQAEPAAALAALPPPPVAELTAAPRSPSRLMGRPAAKWAAGVLLLLLLGLLVLAGLNRSPAAPPHIEQLTHNGHFAPTIANMEALSASATDGMHLFASTIDGGRPQLVSVAVHGGSVDPLTVTDEVPGPTLGDISPDGARLLVRSHLSPQSEQPLWIVPTAGGSAQRVGDVLAHDATWMPDGSTVLYAAGDNLYTVSLPGGRPEHYATLPGRAFWLRWQPGGGLLRLTILDALTHTTTLWELAAGNRKPHRLLAGAGTPGNGCCGVWSADGRDFVFQVSQGGSTDLWDLRAGPLGSFADRPVRLTDGPLQFQSPVASRSGRRIFFQGMDLRSRTERLDGQGRLQPLPPFLAQAVRISYSRDGAWVAWADDRGTLWRARADGTSRLQLTPEGVDVFLAHWSPDGSRIALMAREPGSAWRLYLVSSAGGELHPLLLESRNAADPSWSPDGQSLVFGRTNDMMGTEDAVRNLEVLRLADDKVSTIPGSNGLFSPRWSPDGRFIAALTLDQRRVQLFDVARQAWLTLPVPSGADPVWSADGRTLFVHGSLEPRQPLYRIQVPEMRVETVIDLATLNEIDPVDFVFVGLGRDNSPLIRSRTYTGNLYSLDLP